jgi:cysteine desulfurase
MERLNLQLIPHNMEDCIYLDHAASTPCLPEVVDAMLPFLIDHPGNPGSIVHRAGKYAAEAVSMAREIIAVQLGAAPHEIFFTSGATESINMAIKGIALGTSNGHIITVATEHSAVLESCRSLESQGFRLTLLPVNANGSILEGSLEAAITSDTILIAVMHANNETGVIHDMEHIGRISATTGIPLVCDATQSIGKVPFRPADFGIDCCCFAAHKFYGPKGVGGLYFNTTGKVSWFKPLIVGGAQETGRRGGTLNVAGIVGMSAALKMLNQSATKKEEWQVLSTYFESRLAAMDGVLINSRSVPRIPGIVSASFRLLEGAPLLAALNELLCVSSGASCSSASGKPSHVLTAMGLGQQQAMATIRFSTGLHTTKDQLDQALLHIENCLDLLRSESQVWKMYEKGILKPIASWFHPLNP